MRRQRVIGISDHLSGQKPWWNWYLTPVVNFGEVWRAQLVKFTLLTSMLVPLGSFKVCSDAKERVGGVESNRKHLSYSIPSKTAALVPEFVVEDLPSAELQPRFLHVQWRTCPWAEHSSRSWSYEMKLTDIRRAMWTLENNSPTFFLKWTTF